jgi:hypothetical protein
MGYIFFTNGELPTSEETARHFLEVLSYYFDDPECHIHFRDQVLRPFAKAHDNYREKVQDELPWNPFVGGMFVEIDGISVWNILLSSDKHSHNILLGILYAWGFSTPNTFGWTKENEKDFETKILTKEYQDLGIENY